MPRSLVLAVPLALLSLLLGAALARGVMSPAPSPELDGVQREVRRLSGQVAALEKKIDALETPRRPEPDPGDFSRSARAVPPLPQPPASPAPAGETQLREAVKQAFEERDRRAEQQRDERRKEWESQRIESLAEQLGLAESVRGPFRAILQDHQAKVREAYRKSSGSGPEAAGTIQQDVKKLQEERDAKLAPYLSSDQVRKLDELTARRVDRPGPR